MTDASDEFPLADAEIDIFEDDVVFVSPGTGEGLAEQVRLDDIIGHVRSYSLYSMTRSA